MMTITTTTTDGVESRTVTECPVTVSGEAVMGWRTPFQLRNPCSVRACRIEHALPRAQVGVSCVAVASRW